MSYNECPEEYEGYEIPPKVGGSDLDRLVKCRASTVLLAAKMLKQLAEYGAPEIARPMREVAGEMLQAIADQISEEDIDTAIIAAQKREGT